MRDSTKRRLDRVRSLYESGKTLEEIAKETGYKVSSIGTILNQIGIYRKPRVSDSLETIIKLREAGMTLQQISKHTGFNESYLSEILVKYGFRKQEYTVEEPEVDLKSLNYAKKRKPEKYIHGDKVYTDIAPLIG